MVLDGVGGGSGSGGGGLGILAAGARVRVPFMNEEAAVEGQRDVMTGGSNFFVCASARLKGRQTRPRLMCDAATILPHNQNLCH